MRTYFRFLWRNKLYSAINLAGLTVSLAFSVMIFSHAAGQLRISRSNPDCREIYAVSYDNSAIMCYGMADILRNSIPEAAEVTRFSAPSDGDAIAGYGDRKYTVSLMTADKAFFSMFNVEMKEGNADLPEGGSCVLISESFAEKIAGNGESLVGKTIVIADGPFTVTGIFISNGSCFTSFKVTVKSAVMVSGSFCGLTGSSATFKVILRPGNTTPGIVSTFKCLLFG